MSQESAAQGGGRGQSAAPGGHPPIPAAWGWTLEELLSSWAEDIAELQRLAPMTSGRTAALLHYRAQILEHAGDALREALAAGMPFKLHNDPLSTLLSQGGRAVMLREFELRGEIDKASFCATLMGVDEEVRLALERALAVRAFSLRERT